MLVLFNAYFNSVWWEMTTMAALVWGLAGGVMLMTGTAQAGPRRIVAWGGVIFLLATILFSMVFEELVPLARRAPWPVVARTASGMALFLLATGVLVYGGYVFLRDSLRAFTQHAAANGTGKGAAEDLRRMRVSDWLRAWMPGFRIIGLSALLFVAATLVYQVERFPLG